MGGYQESSGQLSPHPLQSNSQSDRHAREPFLGRCILCTRINLFPQREIVKRPTGGHTAREQVSRR